MLPLLPAVAQSQERLRRAEYTMSQGQQHSGKTTTWQGLRARIVAAGAAQQR